MNSATVICVLQVVKVLVLVSLCLLDLWVKFQVLMSDPFFLLAPLVTLDVDVDVVLEKLQPDVVPTIISQ